MLYCSYPFQFWRNWIILAPAQAWQRGAGARVINICSQAGRLGQVAPPLQSRFQDPDATVEVALRHGAQAVISSDIAAQARRETQRLGVRHVALDATDTDTLGQLMLAVNETGALPVFHEFMVLAANVYDSLFAGSDLLDVSVTQFGGAAGTFSGGRPEVNASHFAGTAYATALAAEVDAVWDEVVDGSVTARQSIRLHNSAMGGKASGLGTTTAVYRDLADTKDRITATVDADGNRTTVTRDVT